MKKYFICLMLSFTVTMVAAAEPHQFHHPQEFLKSVAGRNDAGKKIYQAFCAVCHAKEPQIQLGAPRIGVKSEWDGRQKKGLKKMLQAIDSSLGAMPPRGGCFECTDKQLLAAIKFMLPH